jgi:hypothetical protein
MELLGDVGHVKSSFGLLGGSVGVGARLVHGLWQTYLEIVFNTPDRTPMRRGSSGNSFWFI